MKEEEEKEEEDTAGAEEDGEEITGTKAAEEGEDMSKVDGEGRESQRLTKTGHKAKVANTMNQLSRG